jgi:hypothetical protein
MTVIAVHITTLRQWSRALSHEQRTNRTRWSINGALHVSASIKIRHYCSVYANRPDPIAFVPLAVTTSGRLYPDFICLHFLHSDRAACDLANELDNKVSIEFMHALLETIAFELTN